MSFVVYFEEGVSSQSSFTNPPTPQTMPPLGELYSSLIKKKDGLESPFMIHSFIHRITVPITSYDCFYIYRYI